MPIVTGAPDAPSLNDPASFNARALAFLAWMSDTLVPEIEALSAADWFDVMTSLTDGTAGRVMTVGAFGLGESAPPIITDINEVTLRTGFYTTINTTTGDFPTYAGTAPASKYGKLMVHRYGGGDATQTYHVVGNAGGSAGRMFRRTYNTGTAAWMPWAEVFDTNSVERGSNANGEYVRFPDGTQICTHNVSMSCNSAIGSIFQTTAEETWTFPAAFVNAEPFVTAMSRSNIGIWGRGRPNSASTASVRLLSAVSITTPQTTDLLAIGRWF